MKRLTNYLTICLLSITNIVYSQDCPDDINNSPGSSNNSIEATVYDINGDVIQTITCESTGNSGQIDCDLDSYNFPNGTYISLELTNGNNSTDCYYDMNGQLIDDPLPIELSYFKANSGGLYNIIEWATYSELNNDYFTIEYSSDGINWTIIHKEYGNGTTNEFSEYMFKHRDFEKNNINYYRLSQTDYDGASEMFKIISVNNLENMEIISKVNLLGEEVNNIYSGIVIVTYSDGSVKKIMQR